jgi:hypothetical protein
MPRNSVLLFVRERSLGSCSHILTLVSMSLSVASKGPTEVHPDQLSVALTVDDIARVLLNKQSGHAFSRCDVIRGCRMLI